MTAGRTLLIAGIGLIVVAGAVIGHHYYGEIRHAIFGVDKPKGVETDDLYNAGNKLFKRGRRDRMEVCLTIDDGPHPKSLPRILDTLKRYNAKATFFMVGKRIKERPDLVRQALADGFEIGNHTQDHLRLDTLTPEQVHDEIAQCEANFEAATGGTKMTLFRPPGMRFTPALFKIIGEFGYTTVDWNYGAKDFIAREHGPMLSGSVQNIVDYVLKNVTAGGIILLHDSPETAEALPTILEGLKLKGFAVKDVSQALANLPTPVLVKSNAGQVGKLALKAR